MRRREFLTGLLAAPVVIRTEGLLMPVSQRTLIRVPPIKIYRPDTENFLQLAKIGPNYGDVEFTRRGRDWLGDTFERLDPKFVRPKLRRGYVYDD